MSVNYRALYTTGKYAAKNPAWHSEESPWKAAQILRMLAQHKLRPKTIGEAGCGAGQVLSTLQSQLDPSCEFWGYEISAFALELCLRQANSRLHFKLADLCQEPDAFFDLLLVLDVIEHLEDYFSFLRGIKTKGEFKLFHIPLDLSVQTLVRQNALLKRREMYAHIHYFTKETALRTLEDTGYQILDATYTPRSIELGTEPVQRMLKLPRQVLFALNPDWSARLLGGFSLMVLTK